MAISHKELNDYIISKRRYFHENPELSFQESSTVAYLKKELESMGLNVTEVPKGGIFADLVGGRPGNSVAVRADIDALPVTEENDLPYVSRNRGVMHACGHDAHMAMLLGVVRMAVARKNELSGKIRFMFQRAEERPPGGAVSLISGGVLNGMDFVIGQHVMSTIPAGKVALFPREAMANADEFTIRIHGKGGHGSAPHETVDALMISALYIAEAQTIVSRMIDPQEAGVVTFGTINSGYRYNIIAAHSEMTGTVRTFSEGVRKIIRESLEKLLSRICEAYGATYEFHYEEGYPAVINSPQVTDIIGKAAEEILGKSALLYPKPSMGGEDFAYYLQKIPGAFYFLGVGNQEKGITSPQHSPTYNVDEDALLNGASLLLRAVEKLTSLQKQ
ncbi:MAG: amidohydrolase [Candidatus Thermoplasmatota archaeon]|nr:amidohydrolase [Candidatus Thermoplasmatota archaeon]MCL5732983.1 amidohydrolase [Candidatus Thermoplasmatota archaeon]